MKVAVIGGGVSGLAVAYNLAKAWPSHKDRLSVTVYEADTRFGGNGDTVHFNLSEKPDYHRWADLGVNDFNKSAYVNIVGVMDEIGFHDYKPLEDSTSYYTLDGSTAFVVDDTKPASPQTRKFVSPQTKMPESLSKAVDAFMKWAPIDALKPEFAQYTVRQYIESQFSKYSEYDPQLGPLVIYPRINGMYFTDDVAPSELPFRAAMHYYSIQEGAGGKPPERMYFVGGASTWISALVDYMKGREDWDITFVDNFRAKLHKVDGVWLLQNGTPDGASAASTIVADVVVVATHADDALKLIGSGTSVEVMNCLARVKYLDAISVAHTFAGMMPPDYNAWCTYNILIHQTAAYLKPYTISYVCNRHQNDAENPDYSFFGWPQFFITCNPPVPIPSHYVLTDAATGQPAIANLRHNVYDFDCISAQDEIRGLQGRDNLYFAGGWTVGAGLHEECWIQGRAIADQIVTGDAKHDHLYDASRDNKAFAPDYLRRLIGPGE